MNPINTGTGVTGTSAVTAFGVFPDRASAGRAVGALRRAGYTDYQIGLLGPGDGAPPDERSGLENDPTHTRWEEGTGIRAAAGGLAGLGFGAAVAAGLIPAIGPVIAGGTLVALIASAGAGATVGTVVGGLAGLGVPEDEVRYYAGELEAGRVLVTVRADDPDHAGRILQTEGGRLRRDGTTAVPGNAMPATPY